MSDTNTARLGLVVAVTDLKRRLWTIEDDDRDSISLNDVWALLKPVDAAIKEMQAAAGGDSLDDAIENNGGRFTL